jgi:hypothetical protein
LVGLYALDGVAGKALDCRGPYTDTSRDDDDHQEVLGLTDKIFAENPDFAQNCMTKMSQYFW